MLSVHVNSMLNSMVKEGKRIYRNGINRSVIVENLLIKSDPVKDLKLKAKNIAVDLQATLDRIKVLEDQESKVSGPSYKKDDLHRM